MMRKVIAVLGRMVAVLLFSIVTGKLFDRYPKAFLPVMATVGSLLAVLLLVQWVRRKKKPRARPP